MEGMAPTPFAETLNRFRELAGLTQLQLAQRSGSAPSSINRWQSGAILPKRDNVERLDRALEANGELLAAWRRSANGTGLPEWARDLNAIERGARHLSIAAPTLVPGYLQCPEYARAVFRTGHPLASEEEIERLVALRCDRLAELEKLRVTAVFPLSAVSGVPPSITRSQVQHLLTWVDTGRVTLHVVPAGTTMLVPTAPIMLFSLEGGDLAVTSDHGIGNVTVLPDHHERARSLVTAALAASLPMDISLEHLKDLIT